MWMPLAACAMVLVLVLSACGTPAAPPTTSGQNPTTAAPTAAPAGNEPVTLNLWIFEGEEAFLPRLQEAFETRYPNIKLELTEIPEDQYVTKIDTALAANTPPDIGFVYGGQQRWLKAGKFLPIDEMIKENGIQVENYNRNAISLYCEYEGKTYCVGSYTVIILQ
jgi:ABC-type glycerol-3-phosphate transport system substrate-binding protein